MRVRLRFFAMLREKVGLDAVCDARPGATVAAVWRAFVAEHPEVSQVRVRFAVDEAYVEPGHRLSDGDEVAVFPPVSGGSGPSPRTPVTIGRPRDQSIVNTSVGSFQPVSESRVRRPSVSTR